MNIDTTINVNVGVRMRIENVSSQSGLPKRTIMSHLLLMIADEKLIPKISWRRIRYQKRDRKENWRPMHLYLTPAEYELLLDLKKVYKLSGSAVIALAVEKYIDKLIAHKGDNNRFTCYVFSRFIMDGINCWAQYWGMPKNPGLPLPVRDG